MPCDWKRPIRPIRWPSHRSGGGGPLKARRPGATSWKTEGSPSGIVTCRARRLSVSSRGASPKPPRPRASSFFTRKRMERSKNSRATFMTRTAIWLASPGPGAGPGAASSGTRRARRRPRPGGSRRTKPRRPTSSSGERRGGRWPPRPGGAGRRSPACPAKAERSASNCRGFSLLRVGLKTKDWTPICRARRRSDWLRLSVIIRTGGRRFIFHSRFTTSKPPWNDAPPEAGMPRSVTRTNGPSSTRSFDATFAASSGSAASTISIPGGGEVPGEDPADVLLVVHEQDPSGDAGRSSSGAGSAARPGAPAPGAPAPGAKAPAREARAPGAGRGPARPRAAAGRPWAGAGCRCRAGGTPSPPIPGRSSGPAPRSPASSGSGGSSSPTRMGSSATTRASSGAANEASTAAADSHAVVVDALREVEEQLLGIDATRQRLGGMSRDPRPRSAARR